MAALDGPPVVTRAPKVSLIRETIVPRSSSTRHRAGGGGGNYVLFLSKKSTRFRTRDKITYSLRPLSLSPFRNVRLSVRVFAEVGGWVEEQRVFTARFEQRRRPSRGADPDRHHHHNVPNERLVERGRGL